MKRGLSLLEVLISMFVLTIGLLSVIALVPVGQSEMVKGGIADRTFAMGQAVFKDAKTRGLFIPIYEGKPQNPETYYCLWYQADKTKIKKLDGTTDVAGRLYINEDEVTVVATSATESVLQPIAIDPVSIVANGAAVDRFPYDAPNAAGSNPEYLRRVTVRTYPKNSSPLLHLDNATTAEGLTREIFFCHDDLLLDVPGDPDQSPRSMFFGETQTPPNPSKRMFEPKYSWLMTLVPDEGGQFVSSTVIFRTRDLDNTIDPSKPVYNERTVDITWGTGYGGGEVELESPVREKLSLKAGGWLMATGQERTEDKDGDGNPELRLIAKWYKVRGVDQTVDSNDAIAGNVPPYTQLVRLDGSDWATNPAEAPLKQRAVIFENVVGVYEKTVTLERSSLWSP